MFVVVRRQRRERLELAELRSHSPTCAPCARPPRLDRPGQVRAPQQRPRRPARTPCCAASRAARRANAVDESTPTLRRRVGSRRQDKLMLQRYETLRVKRFLLQPRQDDREDVKVARRSHRRREERLTIRSRNGSENAISHQEDGDKRRGVAGGDPEGRGRHGGNGQGAGSRTKPGAVEGGGASAQATSASVSTPARTSLPASDSASAGRGAESDRRPPVAASTISRGSAGASSQPASVSSPARVRAIESSSKSDAGPNRSRSLRVEMIRIAEALTRFHRRRPSDPRYAQGRGRRTRSRAPLRRAPRTMASCCTISATNETRGSASHQERPILAMPRRPGEWPSQRLPAGRS